VWCSRDQEAYGISSLKTAYEPAESELPAETVWATPKYLALVPQLFERLRHDHGRTSNSCTTCIVGFRRSKPRGLLTISNRTGCSGGDSTPAGNQKSFELIRQHSVTPLAVGETFNSIWDCKHLIENQLIDYIRTTIVHGGASHHAGSQILRLCMACAQASTVPRIYRPLDGLALRYLGAEFRNQEYMRHAPETAKCSRTLFIQGRSASSAVSRRGTTSPSTKSSRQISLLPRQLPIARLERDNVGLVGRLGAALRQADHELAEVFPCSSPMNAAGAFPVPRLRLAHFHLAVRHPFAHVAVE
jgi:mannonate dehydratase